MRELEVPPSISGNHKISVFVNPLSLNSTENSNDSFTEDEVVLRKKNNIGNGTNAAAAEVLRTARRFKKPEFSKGSTGSLDESLFESVDSSTPTTKIKEKNEDAKNLNGEAGSSSLDSITNSLASSSPEIVAANKSTQVMNFFRFSISLCS